MRRRHTFARALVARTRGLARAPALGCFAYGPSLWQLETSSRHVCFPSPLLPTTVERKQHARARPFLFSFSSFFSSPKPLHFSSFFFFKRTNQELGFLSFLASRDAPRVGFAGELAAREEGDGRCRVWPCCRSSRCVLFSLKLFPALVIHFSGRFGRASRPFPHFASHALRPHRWRKRGRGAIGPLLEWVVWEGGSVGARCIPSPLTHPIPDGPCRLDALQTQTSTRSPASSFSPWTADN